MNKKLLTLLAVPILAGVSFGAASLVSAQPASQSQTALSEQAEASETEATEGAKAEQSDAQEAQENAQLAGSVKLTQAEAKAIAESNQGSAANSVQLESENGVAVYEVKFGQTEVKVDANTGAITQDNNSDYQD